METSAKKRGILYFSCFMVFVYYDNMIAHCGLTVRTTIPPLFDCYELMVINECGVKLKVQN